MSKFAQVVGRMIQATRRFGKTEWAKLKEMNFTQKRQYIWEYYRFPIVATIFLTFMSVTWFWSQNPGEYLYMGWFTTGAHDGTREELAEKLSLIAPNPERQRVTITSYAYTGNPQFDSASIQRFVAMIQAGLIDGIFAPYQGIREFAEGEFIQSMGRVMAEVRSICPELYQQVSGNLLSITYMTDFGEELTGNMAVSLADTALLNYMGVDASNLYMAPLFNTSHPQRLARALELIFTYGT